MIWGVGLFVFIVSFWVSFKLLPGLLDFVIEKSQKRGFFNGPWKTHLGVGLENTSRIEKAAIARIGLGGNSAKETVYWNVFTDSEGRELSTKHSYEVILQNPIPINYENKGFWSITAYGQDQFLMESELDKYMIRSSDPTKEYFPLKLILSSDLSHSKSESFIPLSNKTQKFTMALRCYRPLSEMQEYDTCQSIELPKINRI
jgi:hypothetical protein